MQRGEAPPDPTTKKCPECLSDVPIAARRCAFCTSPLPGRRRLPPGTLRSSRLAIRADPGTIPVDATAGREKNPFYWRWIDVNRLGLRSERGRGERARVTVRAVSPLLDLGERTCRRGSCRTGGGPLADLTALTLELQNALRDYPPGHWVAIAPGASEVVANAADPEAARTAAATTATTIRSSSRSPTPCRQSTRRSRRATSCRPPASSTHGRPAASCRFSAPARRLPAACRPCRR